MPTRRKASWQPYARSIRPCPQRDALMQEALAALTTSFYRLSSQSNRMGDRLDGPPLGPAQPEPTISDGTAMGMLQVPPVL
jgi:allophanate hydrolase subunit 2